MEKNFQLAAAERGLGFFTVNLKEGVLTWEKETGRTLGAEADSEGVKFVGHLTSNLRSYVSRGIASNSNERFRCIVPLGDDIVEAVILPTPEAAPGVRQGFFFPYPLQNPMEMMKKYFLSNISNTLRSLLNSVIIASDVVNRAGKEKIVQHVKFLSLMAEDAREVNTLLNRLVEIINYSPPGETKPTEDINVHDLLTNIHANLHYLAEDASIALTLALPDSMPAIRGKITLLLMTFFLSIHYALSKTNPLGEIIITANDQQGLIVEICFSNTDIPPNIAIYPEKHDLAAVRINGWSEGAELQLADSLITLQGGRLSVLDNGRGLGMLKLSLPG